MTSLQEHITFDDRRRRGFSVYIFPMFFPHGLHQPCEFSAIQLRQLFGATPLGVASLRHGLGSCLFLGCGIRWRPAEKTRLEERRSNLVLLNQRNGIVNDNYILIPNDKHIFKGVILDEMRVASTFVCTPGWRELDQSLNFNRLTMLTEEQKPMKTRVKRKIVGTVYGFSMVQPQRIG